MIGELSVRIRPYVPDDKVLWDAWSGGDLGHYQSHILPEGFDEPGSPFELYIIEDPECGAVGAGWIDRIDRAAGTAMLGIFIAHQEWRGRGAGTFAVRFLITAAARNGLKRVGLHVRAGNARAIACYRRCGFEVVQSFPERCFADGCTDGWLRMEIRLDLDNG